MENWILIWFFFFTKKMFLRNLMSMDTEEMIRAQPVDAVVLVGGE